MKQYIHPNTSKWCLNALIALVLVCCRDDDTVSPAKYAMVEGPLIDFITGNTEIFNITYRYNSSNQIISFTVDKNSAKFEYDLTGKLSTATFHYVAVFGKYGYTVYPAYDVNSTYTYDGKRRLIKVDNSAITSGITIDQTWTSFDYNSSGQLVTILNSDLRKTEFSYPNSKTHNANQITTSYASFPATRYFPEYDDKINPFKTMGIFQSRYQPDNNVIKVTKDDQSVIEYVYHYNDEGFPTFVSFLAFSVYENFRFVYDTRQ